MAIYTFDGSSSQTTPPIDLDEDRVILDLELTEVARVDQTADGVQFTATNGTTFLLSGLALADLRTLEEAGRIVANFEVEFARDGDNDIALGSSGLAMGAGGNDTVNGSTETDLLFGNLGADDIFTNGGNDTVFGGQDGDDIHVAGGTADDQVLVYAGLGSDSVSVGFVADGTSAFDGDVTVYGGNGANDGLDGDDLIDIAGAGSHEVYGNGGNDEIYVADGDNTVYGGQGDDDIFVNVDEEGETALIYGGVGADDVDASASEGAVTVYGGNGFNDPRDRGDSIRGGDGDDSIFGNGGDDVLRGGQGADSIFGGQGADTLNGGQSEIDEDTFEFNTLVGGLDADVFVGNVITFDPLTGAADASGLSIVTDFASGEDLLDLGVAVESVQTFQVTGDQVENYDEFQDYFATVAAGVATDGDEGDAVVIEVTDGAFAGTYVGAYQGEGTFEIIGLTGTGHGIGTDDFTAPVA